MSLFNIAQTSHIDFSYAPCYEDKTRSKVHRHLLECEV